MSMKVVEQRGLFALLGSDDTGDVMSRKVPHVHLVVRRFEIDDENHISLTPRSIRLDQFLGAVEIMKADLDALAKKALELVSHPSLSDGEYDLPLAAIGSPDHELGDWTA